jgi:exodeoxyribonuclease VII small subunit
METQAPQTFEDIKARLDEIVEAVSDEELPLDQALGLYEEAVGIGLAASRIMEEGIAANTAEAVDQAQQPQVQVESAAPEQQNEANGE